MEDMERLRKKLDDNHISLNEDVRRKEVDEQKARKEERSKERLARNEEEPSIYRLTLETIDNPKLELIMYPGKIAEAKSKGGLKIAPEAAPDADDDGSGFRSRQRRRQQACGDRSGTRRDAQHPERPGAV